jgi:hypothetical protein
MYRWLKGVQPHAKSYKRMLLCSNILLACLPLSAQALLIPGMKGTLDACNLDACNFVSIHAAFQQRRRPSL